MLVLVPRTAWTRRVAAYVEPGKRIVGVRTARPGGRARAAGKRTEQLGPQRRSVAIVRIIETGARVDMPGEEIGQFGQVLRLHRGSADFRKEQDPRSEEHTSELQSLMRI